MIFVLIVLVGVMIGTFVYSIYGVLTDDLVVWEQMNWKPSYPYSENYKKLSYFDIRKSRW